MKMTAEAARALEDQESLSNQNMNSARATELIDKVDIDKFMRMQKPSERACVVDNDGFIACGPIVGYERPAAPIKLIKPQLSDEMGNKTRIDDGPTNIVPRAARRWEEENR